MKRLVLVLAAACQHGGAPEAPPPASCEIAAARVVGFLAEGPEETKAVIRSVMSDHCKHDGWSDEARNCFSIVNTPEDLDKCAQMMTPAQLAAIQTAGDQLHAQQKPDDAPQ